MLPALLLAALLLLVGIAAGCCLIGRLGGAFSRRPSEAEDGLSPAARELGLVLLSHAGEEQAVEAEEHQELGNPLRLRRALDRGVRVIVAHCASLGEGKDLDDPEGASADSFDLFLRLLFDLVLKRVLRHPETGRAFPASVFMGHPALGL